MRIEKNGYPARRKPLRFTLATILMVGAFWIDSAQALITVGPDADTSCQFHDIGSAVQAAVQSPGADLVAISTGTWSAQSTIFANDNNDLIIEGGFANCNAGVSSDTSTLDGQGAAQHGSIIANFGTGHLTLLHLVITNGDARAGGGVDSEGSNALTLSDVMLLTNHAHFGGGLFVGGSPNPHKVVTLVGVRFNSNTASGSGGELYARDADITLASGGDSYFLGNLAQGQFTDSGDGGGIYALNSNIWVTTHSSSSAFMGANLAQRNGGGAYYGITEGGAYEFFMWNDSATLPLVISDNAAPSGGAFYMKSFSATQQILSLADFRNTIIQGNQANDGAAVSIDSNGQSFGVFTGIQLEQSKVGDVAPPCASGLRCNSLEGNLANSGYIISASASGPAGQASIEFLRGRMLGNTTVSGGGGLIFGGNTLVDVDGSLFASNALSGELVTVVQSSLRFANSTVGYNSLGAGQLFTVTIVPASLDLLHSLLVQPNDPMDAYSVGSGIPVNVHDIGTDGVTGLPSDPGSNVQFLTDPFVNAAQGDFHINITSSAVDRWATTGDPNDPPPTLDLDGGARPFVFNSPTTPYDFGAYEAGAIGDVIFRNGFDPQ